MNRLKEARGRVEKSLSVMYGREDLGASTLFGGGFINFGWWKSLPRGRITARERVESQRALYRVTARRLALRPAEGLAEAGCGRGLGARFLLEAFRLGRVVGVDASGAQVERARALHRKAGGGRLSFRRGRAEDLPLPAASFDALISVEAAQHFASVERFAREAFRVLKPGGRLAVATFFASRPSALPRLAALLPTVASGIDRIVPAGRFLEALRSAGFSGLRRDSLGARVWRGWDRWIGQTEHAGGWGRNWLKARRAGLLDYELISARKP